MIAEALLLVVFYGGLALLALGVVVAVMALISLAFLALALTIDDAVELIRRWRTHSR